MNGKHSISGDDLIDDAREGVQQIIRSKVISEEEEDLMK